MEPIFCNCLYVCIYQLFISARPVRAAKLAALQNFLRDDEPDEEKYLSDAASSNQPGAAAPNVNLNVEFRNAEVELDDLLPRDVLFLLDDEETSD